MRKIAHKIDTREVIKPGSTSLWNWLIGGIWKSFGKPKAVCAQILNDGLCRSLEDKNTDSDID